MKAFQVISPLCFLLLSSCLAYQTTTEGGIRLENPKKFKYNKPKYTQATNALIDVNAIYVRDSSYRHWEEPKWQKLPSSFLRFFAGGQVVRIWCDSLPTTTLANNPNIGIPGYFTTEGTKLKIDMFQ
ncbi:MAG: hypothetical protein AAF840_01670, partial [Bacteroidota bacterium]